ncbi:hypothetical protein C8R44DRAFT_761885 [Mycena epipterygia]|nr:hypothetical protein C8R44DRAFT_761885 [Mycena epipterygia]
MDQPLTSQAAFIYPGPALPPEITDSIIHQLSPNIAALRICSLVCRAWLPASRYTLHKTLSLRGEDIPGFLDVIAPSENTYFSSLRVIDISLCENGPAPSLWKFLPHFLCLESLRIHSSFFHCESPTHPRLRTLELFDVQFGSFTAFTDLISGFPHLKNLRFEKVAWGSMQGWSPVGEDIIPAKPCPRLELDTFSPQISNDSQFLDWLGSEESGPLTSNLTLLMPKMRWGRETLDDDTLAKVSEYLRHLHVHLKHLHIRFGGAIEVQMLDFTSNTALQSLRLNLVLSDDGRSEWNTETYIFTQLPAVLERFRPDRIEHLIVDIHAPPEFERHLSVGRLAAVLGSVPFSRLRKLQFNGPWDSDFDASQAFTSNVLDKLPVSPSRTVVLLDPSANSS